MDSRSSFTWLDFSEFERRKMIDVINAFKERETRDELGIGIIRDAFADFLFPGTSTIQTRAKYFLFVPWKYKHDKESNYSCDIAIKNPWFTPRVLPHFLISHKKLSVFNSLGGHVVMEPCLYECNLIIAYEKVR